MPQEQLRDSTRSDVRTTRMPPPVDLMVIGAEKAGTSSLARYLSAHPRVQGHVLREMNYFAVDAEYADGYARAFGRYFGTERADAIVCGKSVAILDDVRAIDRLASHNSAMHVVVSLRHPVERAWSAFWFARRQELEPLPRFEDAIAAEEVGEKALGQPRRYLGRGKYSRQLEAVYARFPQSQVHVVLNEDLRADPASVCRRLWGLFDLEDFNPDCRREHNGRAVSRWPWLTRALNRPGPIKSVLRHVIPFAARARIREAVAAFNERQASVPAMEPATRERLLAYFRPYNDELRHMLQRRLEGWDR